MLHEEVENDNIAVIETLACGKRPHFMIGCLINLFITQRILPYIQVKQTAQTLVNPRKILSLNGKG